MKKYILLTLFIALGSMGFSQINVEINKELTRKTWVDGETRNINGYRVTRVNGADYGSSRNSKTGMITSIAYLNPSTGVDKSYLEFYITRYEQSIANMKWFMIIIRDEDDKDKIWEQKLEYKAAEMPQGNFFWNYDKIEIPDNIRPPFYVYIRDRNIPELTSFKFKIEK